MSGAGQWSLSRLPLPVISSSSPAAEENQLQRNGRSLVGGVWAPRRRRGGISNLDRLHLDLTRQLA